MALHIFHLTSWNFAVTFVPIVLLFINVDKEKMHLHEIMLSNYISNMVLIKDILSSETHSFTRMKKYKYILAPHEYKFNQSNTNTCMRIIYFHSPSSHITLVFFPEPPLRSTKEGKLEYVPGRDGSQLPPVYPGIPESCAASRYRTF